MLDKAFKTSESRKAISPYIRSEIESKTDLVGGREQQMQHKLKFQIRPDCLALAQQDEDDRSALVSIDSARGERPVRIDSARGGVRRTSQHWLSKRRSTSDAP